VFYQYKTFLGNKNCNGWDMGKEWIVKGVQLRNNTCNWMNKKGRPKKRWKDI